MKLPLVILTVFQWMDWSASSANIDRKLDEFVNNLMNCRGIPGLQLVVVKDGSVVHNKGYGYRDVERQLKVDQNTVFCIGSLTKAFTATVAYDELKRHDFTMDTPLKEILGEDFKLSEPYLTDHVTMRDVLAHRTGVPGYFGGLMVGMVVTREELVRRLRYMPTKHRLGGVYVYNNFMYLVAGYTAGKLARTSWESLVNERIFRPLNMTSSTFIEQLDAENFADSYYTRNKTLEKMPRQVLSMVGPAGPAGSICSSGTDMAKWLLFNLNQTESDLSQLLQELHTPQIITVKKLPMMKPQWPVEGFRYAYNLGWGTGIYRGYEDVSHGGLVSGYRSLIQLIPDKQLGVYLIVNGPSTAVAALASAALKYYTTDLYLGLEPWLNTTTACTFPEPWADAKPPTLLSVTTEQFPPGVFWDQRIEAFEGIYGNLAFGNVTIYLNKSTGFLNLKHGRLGHGSLHPQEKMYQFKLVFDWILAYYSEGDGGAANVTFYQVKDEFQTLTTGYLPDDIKFHRDLKSVDPFEFRYECSSGAKFLLFSYSVLLVFTPFLFYVVHDELL